MILHEVDFVMIEALMPHIYPMLKEKSEVSNSKNREQCQCHLKVYEVDICMIEAFVPHINLMLKEKSEVSNS